MAQEWMQVDLDLPEKPQFQRIVSLSGEPPETVFFRLFHFWRWVERHTTDGVFPGIDVDTIARMFGGSPEFWRTLADPAVDWLWIFEDRIEIPRYEKRFDKSAKRRAQDAKQKAKDRAAKAVENASDSRRNLSAPRRQKPDQEKNQRSEREKNKNFSDQSVRAPAGARDTVGQPTPPGPPPDGSDQKDFYSRGAATPTDAAASNQKEQGELFTRVELARVMEVAEELFRQANYAGDDGGIFYQAAAVLEANPGELTRHKLIDAARGCRQGARNAPGYFRASLRNLCPDFDQRLKGVWLVPKWPDQPPNRLPRKKREALQLRRPPADTGPADDTEAARQHVLRQLAAVQ